jgi:hypothetical protein
VSRYKQFGTFPALGSANCQLRSPFAPGDSDFPLSEAIRDANVGFRWKRRKLVRRGVEVKRIAI